jgi:hypothetical protein
MIRKVRTHRTSHNNQKQKKSLLHAGANKPTVEDSEGTT